MKGFAGKTALVTGGTRGIGHAIAARLQAEGATVIVTGRTGGAAGPQGGRHLSVDFADIQATEAFAAGIAAEPIDVLINNAGINAISPIAEIDPKDFDRIHLVNVRAPMLLCRAVIPGMRARGWGRIVNVSSIFGIVTKEQRASYSSSKFALDGLTAALAVEVARDGILANCVAPGFVDTELTRRILSEAAISELVNDVPLRRLAMPEEVAAFVVWLASTENTFITAQNIAIDGGFTRV